MIYYTYWFRRRLWRNITTIIALYVLPLPLLLLLLFYLPQNYDDNNYTGMLFLSAIACYVTARGTLTAVRCLRRLFPSCDRRRYFYRGQTFLDSTEEWASLRDSRVIVSRCFRCLLYGDTSNLAFLNLCWIKNVVYIYSCIRLFI